MTNLEFNDTLSLISEIIDRLENKKDDIDRVISRLEAAHSSLADLRLRYKDHMDV